MMWGAWYNKMGRAHNEDVSAKHKIYNRQTIQTFHQDIQTLEFDVSERKLQRAVKGTYDTTQAWIDAFCGARETYEGKFEEETGEELKKYKPKTQKGQGLPDFDIEEWMRDGKAE